jgi:PAS domain S-box-containing protein
VATEGIRVTGPSDSGFSDPRKIKERDHDRRLRSLFDLSPQMVCLAGPDGYFKRVNRSFEMTLGYTSEELLSRRFIYLVHPEDRRETLREVRRITEGLPTVGFENRCRHRDGSYRWFSWTVTPVQEDGLFYAAAIDVTESKRAEHWFQGLLESSPDATVIIDQLGKIVLVNAFTERLFGYPRDDLLGQPIEILVPRHLRKVHGTHRKGFFAHPRLRPMGTGISFPALRMDGTEFPAEISLGPLSTDQGTFVFCTIRDISDRLESAEALRRREERFDLAVRGTDAGIWDWSLKSNKVFFSRRWKGMLGYDPGEVGDDFAEWVTRLHPDDRDRALAHLQDYLKGGSADYELEHRLLHKDGSYRWILARGAAVRDPDGKPYRMAGSHIDITHMKESESVLRKQAGELLAARAIQERLLPQKPPFLPGFDVAGVVHPAEFAGGDHFDFIPLPNESMGFVVSDVADHGFGSALLMACTRAYLRLLIETEAGLVAAVTRLSSILFQETDSDRFVTLFFGRLDTESGIFRYVNAGHPAGLVFSRTGEVKARLESTGIPLGALFGAEYGTEGTVTLEKGDTVLLITDGILESESPAGDQFGEERVVQVVRSNLQMGAQDLIEGLCRAVRAFANSDELADDITAVAIKCDGLGLRQVSKAWSG